MPKKTNSKQPDPADSLISPELQKMIDNQSKIQSALSSQYEHINHNMFGTLKAQEVLGSSAAEEISKSFQAKQDIVNKMEHNMNISSTAMEAANIANKAMQSMQSMYSPLEQYIKQQNEISSAMTSVTQNLYQNSIGSSLTAMQAMMETSQWRDEIENSMQKWTRIAKIAEMRAAYIDGIKPYLEKELSKLRDQIPETKEVSIYDMIEYALLIRNLDKAEYDELIEECKEFENNWNGDTVVAKYMSLIIPAILTALEEYNADKGNTDTTERARIPIVMPPNLQSKPPSWHTMPNQRLANELQKGIINAGATDLIVANRGKKSEITTYVMATYDIPEGVTGLTETNYTEYDRQVHDAICSLWEYGHESHIFTADMIAREMNHKTDTEKVSPQQKGAITKSIEKMRKIDIEVDATEEIKKRKIELDGKPVTSFKYQGALLMLSRIEVTAGGKTVQAYQIEKEPMLLSYAILTNQLVTVKAKLLDVKEIDNKGNITPISIKSSDERISVKGYLLRRIAVMKNDKTKKKTHQSNIILFESLFAETGIENLNHANRLKDYVFLCLDYWKAEKHIKGYTKRKSTGKKGYDAVIIDL